MDIYADLHIHLGRAGGRPVKISASAQLTLRRLIPACARDKGLHIVGIVDCQAPAVLAELRGLQAAGELAPLAGGGLVWARAPLVVLPGAEMQVVEARGPAHYVIYLPDLAAMTALSSWLEERVSNVGLSTPQVPVGARDLARLAAAAGGLLVPAHVFTPHRSLYGSCTDSLGQVVDAPDIPAIELGLSADTELADRLPELAGVRFLSNSDAHSLRTVAREYNVFEAVGPRSVSLAGLQAALRGRPGPRLKANVGLNPRLGKYHRTHCRECGSTASAPPPVHTCRACGSRRVTFGVLDRIHELAGDNPPRHPTHRPPYRHHVPLPYVPGIGPRTRERLVERFGSEIAVRQAPGQALEEVVGPRLARAVSLASQGRLHIAPGGGGRYGRVESCPGPGTHKPDCGG